MVIIQAGTMLTEIEKACATDLLKELELEDLNELAKTSTGGVIQPLNLQDSLNAILLHTKDIRSLLWRKKITKSLLFRYLHGRNISFPGNAEKASLVEIVVNFWQKNSTAVSSSNETLNATEEPNTLKKLAVKFAEWFYNRVNTIVTQKMNNVSTSEKLKEEDFWDDAIISVKLMHGSEVIGDYKSEGSKESLALINYICNEHALFFSPNLNEAGTRGLTEPHGLVLVMNCGTLHAASGQNCVGLYEQVFSLIKDPMSDNWKIKASQLMLRSQEVKTTPVLPSGNLPISSF